MILAERAIKRGDLPEAIQAWLNGALEEASDLEVKVTTGPGGWITIMPDEEIIESMIRLQVRMDPIASGKPPYTARVKEIAGSRVIAEHPSPDGSTIRRVLPTSSLAAGLGYHGDKPLEFLAAVGIFEGAPISLAASMPSMTQLELFAEQIMRGLDRVAILDASVGEIDEICNLLGDQIAHHDHLTLSAHMLYSRLGARLDKLVKNLQKNLPSQAIIKPIPWSQAAQYLESCNISLEEVLAKLW